MYSVWLFILRFSGTVAQSVRAARADGAARTDAVSQDCDQYATYAFFIALLVGPVLSKAVLKATNKPDSH